MTLRKLLILSLALLVAGPMEAQKKKKRPRKPAVEVPKEDPRITNMREMTQQILIIDSIVADKFANDAQQKACPSNAIPEGWEGLDVGPETQERFKAAIRDDLQDFHWEGGEWSGLCQRDG